MSCVRFIGNWNTPLTRGVQGRTSMTRVVIGWVWYSGMRSTNNEKLVASWVWFISMTLLQCRCNRRKYREACVVRRLHWHLVPWKGRKWRKAQIQNFVIRDMFLTPNVNAYERNILSTPNGNVHKRRVFRRATQYVKVCGYDKEQWTSQATTQRWWLVMVPCSDWSTLVPQQSLTSESEEKHHTMPGVSYQEILFLFAVISHLTWTCELCILKDSTHCASTNSKCIEHSYTYRFPVCVKILGVPSTASSVTTASSSTLPSSSVLSNISTYSLPTIIPSPDKPFPLIEFLVVQDFATQWTRPIFIFDSSPFLLDNWTHDVFNVMSQYH